MAEWVQIGQSIGAFVLSQHVVVGNYLYKVGGEISQSNYNTTNRMQRINLDNGQITELQPMKRSRSEFAIAYMAGYIYVFGGYYSGQGTEYTMSWSERYSIATNTWEDITSRPYTAARSSAITVGNLIYIFGGWVQGAVSQLYVAQSIHIYNPASDIYTTLGVSLTTPRWMPALAALNNQIYVINGYDPRENGMVPTNAFEIYDIAAATIQKGGSSIFELVRSKAETFESEIYLQNTQNSVAAFNAETQIWRMLAPIPEQVEHGGLYLYNSKLYSPPYSNAGYLYEFDLSFVTISNPSPASGFVNEHQANTFTWELVTNPSSVTQKSAIFQWRPKGGTIRQIAITGATQSVTVPAETFPNGAIEWRIQATGSNNFASDFTAWMELTTIDQQPLAPVNLSPNSGQEDGTKPITFYWTHRSPLSTPQSAFEIQYTLSPDAEQPAWQVLSGKVTGADGYFTVAANSIVPTDPTGKIGWRVRTYNSDNLAGPWSAPAYFIVHAAPQKPTIISVTPARSRPVVTWQSTGQVGYQLQVRNGDTIFYDSGETHGEQKQHAVASTGDVYLANGTYIVYLRIKNIRGLWSDWAEYSIVINAPRRMTITLEGEAIENGAFLSWTNEVVT